MNWLDRIEAKNEEMRKRIDRRKSKLKIEVKKEKELTLQEFEKQNNTRHIITILFLGIAHFFTGTSYYISISVGILMFYLNMYLRNKLYKKYRW